MTCIVGLVHDGSVYIGGDSLGSDSGFNCKVRSDKKVFKNRAFVMGFTTSYRMGQLLTYSLQPPTIAEDQDVMEFMVNDFVESVRSCLKEGGFTKIEDNSETGGNFLVGFQGRLFNIDCDFQVGESVHGFDACGCGEAYALGSMFNSDGEPPKSRVLRALKTAQEFSAGVRGPFHVVSSK